MDESDKYVFDKIKWHKFIDDSILVDAILGRLLHGAHKFNEGDHLTQKEDP